MPQFDNTIILPEIFWLFFSFFIFYFYLAIFNKVSILRNSFYRQNWLYSFLKFSKNLQNNIFISSKCYLENIYFKYLIDRGLIIEYSLKAYSILSKNKNTSIYNIRKNFHLLIKQYLY